MTIESLAPPAPQPLPVDTALRDAWTDAELHACWPVMQQLRPRLADAGEFTRRVHHMRAVGYRLLAAWHGPQVLALGGYRLQENLVYGQFLYVDDLVTRDTARGQHWGARILQHLAGVAERAGCAALVLDTAVANSGAQRFYARQGLSNRAMGFSLALPHDRRDATHP